MQIRYAVGQDQYQRMSTAELRAHFLVEKLFVPGGIELVYWETERTVLGGVCPADVPLKLETDAALASDFFCQRRELGAFNLGGPGQVTVDGSSFSLANQDGIYVGRGSREITFSSTEPENPARFYLISYPAHVAHPTCLIPRQSARQVDLGETATANQRTIFQYIHEGGTPSCQLVTGLTRLQAGSIWNTMPPHTHLRRSEVYFYFDLPENGAVFHFMGHGDETRHLVLRDGQAVLSPCWSVHSGAGTQAYSFIWAMGGENQAFTDMDAIKIGDLR
jgi:4-deoxy-L-threo-5-hexosulose-uronate ketol-isomerase